MNRISTSLLSAFIVLALLLGGTKTANAGLKSKAALAAGGYVLVKWVPKYLKSQSPEIKKKALQKITGVLAKHPSLADKALSIANKVAGKSNIAKDRLDKLTAFLRTNTSLPPPLSAAALRATKGTAWGVKSLPVIKEGTKWLKGSHGSFGKVPRQIGEKLSGKTFNSFSEFRVEFWKQVSKDSVLSKQFGTANVRRMKDGLAPVAHKTQHNGLNKSFQLHHKRPINKGGSVYSLDNLLVVSPKYHKYILDKGFHFGK